MLRRQIGGALQQVRGAVEIGLLEARGGVVELLLRVAQAGGSRSRARFLFGPPSFRFGPQAFLFGAPAFFFDSPSFLFDSSPFLFSSPGLLLPGALCLELKR